MEQGYFHNEDQPLTYHGRMAKSGRIGMAVMTSMMAGMFVMFTAFSVGIPPLLVVLLLLATITLTLLPFLRNVTLTLTQQGIQVEMRPLWPANASYGRSSHWIPWENIRSYQVGKDMNRSFREVRYLKIWTKGGPRIFVNDGETTYSKDQFTRFTEGLERAIQRYNAHKTPGAYSEPSLRPAIRRKRVFYQTLFGKIVAVGMVALTALLGTVMVAEGLGSGGSYFKLIVVLIPGSAYMFYRSFLKKDPL